MAETLLVGAIIAVAAGYAAYRLFVRPSCSCGDSCGCSGKTSGCCGSKPRK